MDKRSGPGVTLVGLGPGSPEHLTREAWSILQTAPEIYLRTAQHPVVPYLPPQLTIHSFDNLYETASGFGEVYEQIITEILSLAGRPKGVIYAVPRPSVCRRSDGSGDRPPRIGGGSAGPAGRRAQFSGADLCGIAG